MTKLLTYLTSLGRVLPPLLKLVLGTLPMTKIRQRDPRLTLFCLCASAGPAMEAAAAILLIGRTLTNGTPTCLHTISLPRPVRPEPPLDTDGHVVFCQNEYHPAYKVLSYRNLIAASRRGELSCRGKSRGPRAAKLGALSLAKVSFGKVVVK